MKKCNRLILLFLLILLANNQETDAYDLEKGKNVFNQNCLACHEKGQNVIIPEKNLKRLTLEANGMYSHEAIIYQVLKLLLKSYKEYFNVYLYSLIILVILLCCRICHYFS